MSVWVYIVDVVSSNQYSRQGKLASIWSKGHIADVVTTLFSHVYEYSVPQSS